MMIDWAGQLFLLKLPNSLPIKLLADKVLLDLITNEGFSELSAIYHRAMSITGESKLELVIKRPEFRDKHTKQYNPVLLLAARAETTIELKVVEPDSNIRELVCATNIMPEPLDEFAADCTVVSIEHAMWILDPNKRLYQRDSKPVNIDVRINRKHKFREARVSDLYENYQDVVNRKEYELIRDMYDMYLDRLGFPKLAFKHVLMRYNKTDHEEEQEENQEGEGQDNPEELFVATCKDDEEHESKLPTELLTAKGEKLILRKKLRVITHKTPKIGLEAYIFLNVLLYHPHTAEEEVKVGFEELEKIVDNK